mgnify:FL=1
MKTSEIIRIAIAAATIVLGVMAYSLLVVAQSATL